MWWFVASNICFDCLQHPLSLSRYAGPISRARVVSSPFSRLSRVQRTSKSRLARGGKRRGTEEVQRARTGRTDRSPPCRSRLFTLTKEGEPFSVVTNVCTRRPVFLLLLCPADTGKDRLKEVEYGIWLDALDS